MHKNTSDFFFSFFEKNSFTTVFENIYLKQEKNTIINKSYDETGNLKKINSVMFIPNYITPKCNRALFKTKKISQFFKGYAIALDEFSTVNEYLKFRFKKNSKSILKKTRKLEHCFSINYTFYYGNISKEDYTFFMDKLENMLINRFKERNDTSQNLLNWEHYQKIFFDLINDKKASLFVIKNNNEPICISIGNHCNGKLFSSVSSYDINFAKFSLGNIEIYKKLEWCINNNHNTYEFGMGDLSYKREWSNNIYNFEHQIIYPKKSLKGAFFGYIEFLKVYIKEAIYKTAYVKYKSWKAKNKKAYVFNDRFKITSVEKTNDYEGFQKIEYQQSKYEFLKKPIYNFLYYTMDKENDITVYKTPENKKSYLIVGKSKNEKITFC